MTVFKHFRDVISGRIKHWNDTNNTIFNELWSKSEKLGSPYDLIFKEFNISALLVVQMLMGVKYETEKIFNIDLKKISIHQFRQLYYVLLSCFTFIFYTSNPYLKEEIKKTLFRVTEEPKLVEKYLQSLDEIGKIDSIMVGKVWKKVLEVIGFSKREDPGQLAAFMLYLFENYKQAAESIKAKLNF